MMPLMLLSALCSLDFQVEVTALEPHHISYAVCQDTKQKRAETYHNPQNWENDIGQILAGERNRYGEMVNQEQDIEH